MHHAHPWPQTNGQNKHPKACRSPLGMLALAIFTMMLMIRPAMANSLNLTYEHTYAGSGMSYPFGLALSPNQDAIYAAAFNSNDVHQWLAASPTHVDSFGGSTHFKYAYGIDVDHDGNIYVTTTGGAIGDYVKAYDSNYNPLFTNARNYSPYDVAIEHDNAITGYNYSWTLESMSNGGRLIKRYADNAVNTDILKIGSGANTVLDPGFNEPRGLTVDPNTNAIFVADTDNHRIVKITQTASFSYTYTAFGSAGSGLGEFNQPYGVAVDSQGNIWVSERGNDRIQKFAADFTPLGWFTGAPGHAFGDSWDIAVSDIGEVYIATGNEIQKYHEAAPPIPAPLAVAVGAVMFGTMQLRRRRKTHAG